MTARLRKFLSWLRETFWLVPPLMVIAGVLGAVALVSLDRSGLMPQSIIDSPWLYNGGGTGARTLLGAVVSSTIGVAGTIFSITIAALSLAAGQMGPRLLRNFTRDRGNQITLGIFLGTFSYALMVLRSVRTESEGTFTPYVALNISILLAFVCVATLVFFVGHMAGRINVDTVIELVSQDVHAAIKRLASKADETKPPPDSFWRGAAVVSDARRGYLQQFSGDSLADWAAEKGTAIRLLARPGDFVFPGAPIAFVNPPVKGAEEAIRDATALGSQRVSASDLEFELRQLVEVAVRALSPGINDPHTAMTVLERLGAALCDMVTVYPPTSIYLRKGKPALIVPAIDYDGLTDTMFHMIRQNASDSPAVLIRLIEVLTVVAGYEREPERVKSLERHADLVLDDAQRNIASPADLADIRARHQTFTAVAAHGALGYLK